MADLLSVRVKVKQFRGCGAAPPSPPDLYVTVAWAGVPGSTVHRTEHRVTDDTTAPGTCSWRDEFKLPSPDTAHRAILDHSLASLPDPSLLPRLSFTVWDDAADDVVGEDSICPWTVAGFGTGWTERWVPLMPADPDSVASDVANAALLISVMTGPAPKPCTTRVVLHDVIDLSTSSGPAERAPLTAVVTTTDPNNSGALQRQDLQSDSSGSDEAMLSFGGRSVDFTAARGGQLSIRLHRSNPDADSNPKTPEASVCVRVPCDVGTHLSPEAETKHDGVYHRCTVPLALGLNATEATVTGKEAESAAVIHDPRVADVGTGPRLVLSVCVVPWGAAVPSEEVAAAVAKVEGDETPRVQFAKGDDLEHVAATTPEAHTPEKEHQAREPHPAITASDSNTDVNGTTDEGTKEPLSPPDRTDTAAADGSATPPSDAGHDESHTAPGTTPADQHGDHVNDDEGAVVVEAPVDEPTAASPALNPQGVESGPRSGSVTPPSPTRSAESHESAKGQQSSPSPKSGRNSDGGRPQQSNGASRGSTTPRSRTPSGSGSSSRTSPRRSTRSPSRSTSSTPRSQRSASRSPSASSSVTSETRTSLRTGASELVRAEDLPDLAVRRAEHRALSPRRHHDDHDEDGHNRRHREEHQRTQRSGSASSSAGDSDVDQTPRAEDHGRRSTKGPRETTTTQGEGDAPASAVSADMKALLFGDYDAAAVQDGDPEDVARAFKEAMRAVQKVSNRYNALAAEAKKPLKLERNGACYGPGRSAVQAKAAQDATLQEISRQQFQFSCAMRQLCAEHEAVIGNLSAVLEDAMPKASAKEAVLQSDPIDAATVPPAATLTDLLANSAPSRILSVTLDTPAPAAGSGGSSGGAARRPAGSAPPVADPLTATHIVVTRSSPVLASAGAGPAAAAKGPLRHAELEVRGGDVERIPLSTAFAATALHEAGTALQRAKATLANVTQSVGREATQALQAVVTERLRVQRCTEHAAVIAFVEQQFMAIDALRTDITPSGAPVGDNDHEEPGHGGKSAREAAEIPATTRKEAQVLGPTLRVVLEDCRRAAATLEHEAKTAARRSQSTKLAAKVGGEAAAAALRHKATDCLAKRRWLIDVEAALCRCAVDRRGLLGVVQRERLQAQQQQADAAAAVRTAAREVERWKSRCGRLRLELDASAEKHRADYRTIVSLEGDIRFLKNRGPVSSGSHAGTPQRSAASSRPATAAAVAARPFVAAEPMSPGALSTSVEMDGVATTPSYLRPLNRPGTAGGQRSSSPALPPRPASASMRLSCHKEEEALVERLYAKPLMARDRRDRQLEEELARTAQLRGGGWDRSGRPKKPPRRTAEEFSERMYYSQKEEKRRREAKRWQQVERESEVLRRGRFAGARPLSASLRNEATQRLAIEDVAKYKGRRERLYEQVVQSRELVPSRRTEAQRAATVERLYSPDHSPSPTRSPTRHQ